jgi:hypothetical protein
MERAQAVSKTRMLGPLVSKKADAELPYPPQALEFGRIDETNQQIAFVRIGRQPDNVVNRVAVYFFDWRTPNFACFADLR